MDITSQTPDAILESAFAFWNSKVLLTAVTFDLFSTLGQKRLTGAEIGTTTWPASSRHRRFP